MRLRHLFVVLIVVVGAALVIFLRESTDLPGVEGTEEARGEEATGGTEVTAEAAAAPSGLSEEEARGELERGLELRKQGRFKAAIAIFRRALEKDPRGELANEFLFEIGQTQYQIAKNKFSGGASKKEAEPTLIQALATFSSVIESYPASKRAASASYMSGATLVLLEEPEKALEVFESTFRRYPDYVARSRALLRIGMVLVVLDRIPEGVDTFKQVIREFPHRTGDVKNAKKYLQQIEIVGRKYTPIRAHTWLNGVVDDTGLASFEGEVIVLVFLATWCSSCSDEVPHLRRLIVEWSERGVVFLGALNPKDSMNEAVSIKVEDYARKHELEFLDVGLVEDSRPWNAYRTEWLPAAVVIDRRGIIQWRGHPALFPGDLVTRVLAE